jgi:hypothetical protein
MAETREQVLATIERYLAWAHARKINRWCKELRDEIELIRILRDVPEMVEIIDGHVRKYEAALRCLEEPEATVTGRAAA